jgi:alpha-tubulin suppressor-like RCC1 family protein
MTEISKSYTNRQYPPYAISNNGVYFNNDLTYSSSTIAGTDINGTQYGGGSYIVKYSSYKSSSNSNSSSISSNNVNINNLDLIVYYKFEDNSTNMLLDSTGNGHNLINNTGTFDNVNYRVGSTGSISFSNQVAQIPTTFNISTVYNNNNGITFSLWFKFNPTLQTTFSRFFEFNNTGLVDGNRILLCRQASGSVNSLQCSIWDNGINTTFITSVTFTDNQWHHIIWSISETGIWNIYIDGIKQNCTITKQIPNSNTWLYQYLGASPCDVHPYYGNIDDFRIYKKTITNDEVIAIYYNIINSHNTGLIAYYKFDNNETNMLLDSTSNVYDLTNNGATFDISDYQIGYGSVYIPNNSSYLSNSSIDLSAKSFTVSFWVKLTKSTNAKQYIISQGNAYSAGTFFAAHWEYKTSTQGCFKILFLSNDLEGTNINYTTVLNKWVHVAFVLNYSEPKASYIYVNGWLNATRSISLTTAFAPGTFRIGLNSIEPNNTFFGNIDDLRIYYRAITAEEVTAIYNNNPISSAISIYPPTPMTASSTTINNIIYKGCASDSFNFNSFDGWRVFAKIGGGTAWTTGSSYNSDGSISGGVTFGNDTNYRGHYVGVDMGQQIIIQLYNLKRGWSPLGNGNRNPKNWKIYATNNTACYNSGTRGSLNTSSAYGWVAIDTRSNQTSYADTTLFTINNNTSNTSYRFYALHVNATISGDQYGGYCELSEWSIYGTQNLTNIITVNNTDLMAHYKFDNNETNMLLDSTSNGYNLTNNGTTFDISDYQIGNGSVYIPNNSSYLSNSSIDLSAKSFTVSFWIKFTKSTNAKQFIINQGNAYSASMFFSAYWEYFSSTQGCFKILFLSDDLEGTSINYISILNKWVHVAFVLNYSEPKASYIYVNGVLNATRSVSLTTAFAPGTFRIGLNSIEPNNTFFGNIDDLRIYYRAITAEEVTAIYNNSPISSVITNYPPSPMTGPTTNINNIIYRACAYDTYSGYNPWQAFDNSNTRYVSNGYFAANGSINGGVTFGNDTNYRGIYLAIDMEQQILIQSYNIKKGYSINGEGNRNPKNWKIYATNNIACWNAAGSGSLNISSAYDWAEIDIRSNLTTYGNTTLFTINNNTSNTAYRFYALQVNAIISADQHGGYLDINAWDLFGTQNLTNPNLTNIAKPWIILKNNPAYWTTIDISSSQPNWGGNYDLVAPYSYLDNSYLVNNFTGDYITIKLPNKIYLTKYVICSTINKLSKAPQHFSMYGSIDGVNWNIIVEKHLTQTSYINTQIPNSTYSTGYYIDNEIKSTVAYDYYGIVVNKLFGPLDTSDNNLSFSLWNVYGTNNFKGESYFEYGIVADTSKTIGSSLKDGLIRTNNSNIFIKSGNSTTPALTLGTNNRVAINKNIANEALDVSGSIIAKEYRIKNQNYPIIDVSGNIAASGTTDIFGNLTLNNNKFVVNSSTGKLSVAGTLDISKNININSGKTIIDSSGNIKSQGNFDLSSNININNYVLVDTSGSVIMNNTLDLSNNATLRKNLEIKGNIKSSTFTTNSSINKVSIRNTSVDPSYNFHVSGSTRLEGNLDVEGNIIIVDTVQQTSEQFIINNDGSTVALTAKQIGAQPIVDFRDDGISVFYLADNGLLGLGTTTPSYTVDVSGSCYVQKALDVSGNVNINGNTYSSESIQFNNILDVSQNLNINNKFVVDSSGNIDISGNMLIFGYLISNGNNANSGGFQQDGNAIINGGLRVLYNIDISQNLRVLDTFIVDASGNIKSKGQFDLSNNLSNGSIFSINTTGNVYSSGNIDISKNFNINNGVFSADVSGNIIVNGFIDISKNLYVNGNKFTIDQNGNITAMGNFDISNNLTINTNKFIVDVSGNIKSAGNLDITNNFIINNGTFKIDNNGNISSQSNFDISGNMSINGSKFTASNTGNIKSAGTLDISKNFLINNDKFIVDSSGNTIAKGNVDISTNLSIGNNTFNVNKNGNIQSSGALDVSKNLKIGISMLTVDHQNKRVGINTTTPEYSLDISGQIVTNKTTMGSSYTSNSLNIIEPNITSGGPITPITIGTDYKYLTFTYQAPSVVLREYPPSAMTINSTTLSVGGTDASGNTYGAGTYTINYPYGISNIAVYTLFNKLIGGDHIGSMGALYNGYYIGDFSNDTRTSFGTYFGSCTGTLNDRVWTFLSSSDPGISIDLSQDTSTNKYYGSTFTYSLPSPIYLQNIQLYNRSTYSTFAAQAPKSFRVYGMNSGDSGWTQIANYSNLNAWTSYTSTSVSSNIIWDGATNAESLTFKINANASYSIYGFVVNALVGTTNENFTLAEIKLFGTDYYVPASSQTQYTINFPTEGTECSALIVGNPNYTYLQNLSLFGTYNIVVGNTSNITKSDNSITYNNNVTTQTVPFTNTITNSTITYNLVPKVIIRYKLTKGSTGNSVLTTTRKITQISVGSGGQTLFLRESDGVVFACGPNGNGQLGINSNVDQLTMVQVAGVNGTGYITDITQVSAGFSSLFLRGSDGAIFGCGWNEQGTLGINNFTNQNKLQQVLGVNGIGYITGISKIYTGFYDSLFIRGSDGAVFGCGYNSQGQLGINTTTRQSTLQQVKGVGGIEYITGITQVAMGDNIGLFLRGSDGVVFSCGYNGHGQLGVGNTTSSTTLQQVKAPGGIGYITGITYIAAGWFSLYLIRGSDGAVFTCGNNEYGNLGINSTTHYSTLQQVKGVNGIGYITGITQIDAGQSHTVFLRGSDGAVFACGKNQYGELGINSTTQCTTLQQVLGENGTDYITGITSISAGQNNTFFYRGSDSAIFSCGYNVSGNLGINSTTNQSTLQRVLDSNSFLSVLTRSGTNDSILATKNNTLITSTPISEFSDEDYISFSSTTADYTFTCMQDISCDVLVVGGGGGGARRMAGGGGAGCMIYDTNVVFTAGTYTLIVGKGGIGSATPDNIKGAGWGYGYDITLKRGGNGGASEIIKESGDVYYRATGGSGGLGGNTDYGVPSSLKPLPGGSGGGNGGKDGAYGGLLSTSNIVRGVQVNVLNNIESPTVDPSYSSSVCFGNEGGIGGGDSPWMGGGGGGAGSRGTDVNNKPHSTANNATGVGGIGKECEITGINTFYAGGGGGGNYEMMEFYNDGGLGGGGRSGTGTVVPFKGTDGLGGGGGSDGADYFAGADGGSGIIVLRFRYPTNNVSTQIIYSNNATFGYMDTSMSFIPAIVQLNTGQTFINSLSQYINFNFGNNNKCKMDISGNLILNGDILIYSDGRIKENITTITTALDKVNEMSGITYNIINKPRKQIGVIAQEVEKVLPEVIKEEGGLKTVAYPNMIGLLIESLKELNDKVEQTI